MGSNTLRNRPYSSTQPMIEWINLLLGIFLLISPWIGLGGSVAATWNAVICGALVACIAGYAITKPTPGAEMTNLSLGLWLLVAPWTMDFFANGGATVTSVLVGLGIVCLAGLQLCTLRNTTQA